jgi:ubiquinone/menaquinone biosynthesis C-methylase UbiE
MTETIVKGREAIKEAYRDRCRANQYIQARFDDPIGAEVHRRQLDVVNRQIARVQPTSLLEVACGPARLTTDIDYVQKSVAVEQSPAMLEQARGRLIEAGRSQWTLLEGDAFELQLDPTSFDMAVTFRFVRHFDVADRARLLVEIRRVLRPGGYLIFDVASARAYHWILKKWGVAGSWVDDYWFDRPAFIKEMQDQGFKVEATYPVHAAIKTQYYLYAYLHRRCPKTTIALSRAVTSLTSVNPYEWVAVCKSA